MANNEKGETTPERSEKNEVLEELELMKNSQKQKFNEFAEKLQSMEKSISKILKFDEKPKSAKKFVLKNVFENVTRLANRKSVSNESLEHFNMKWFIVSPLFRSEMNIRSKQNFEFRLKGYNDAIVSRTKKCDFNERVDCGYESFPWEYVYYHLIDDNLTVEVDVEILKMSGIEKKKKRLFDESQKDISDVILVVQDIQFYVSKLYLAAQSSFFKTLLFGNFSESAKSEIPLSGIDSDDFQCFLEVLYGESAIDDSTVEGILHIADLYATPMVIRKCEDFLLEKSGKSAKKLLEMVASYNLENLKEKCMSEIKTVADIRAVLPPNTEDMDHQMLAKLLDKSLSLH